MSIFGIICITLIACNRAGSQLAKDSPMVFTDPVTLYAGRASVILPKSATVAVGSADFDGVQITPVGNPYKKSVDQLWSDKVRQVQEEFGSKVTSTIVSGDPLHGQRALFYKFDGTDPLTPTTSMKLDLWTEMDGKLFELSISGTNADRPVLEQTIRTVLHSMQPPQGKVDANIFAANDVYVRLAPQIGEAVSAVFRFDQGYELSLTTDVYKHPHPPTVIKRFQDRSSQLANGDTVQTLLAGPAQAGTFKGEQAAIRLTQQASHTDIYIAEFEFAGVEPGSPLQPTISMRFTRNSSDGPVSAEQFLGMWQGILQGFSIRGR